MKTLFCLLLVIGNAIAQPVIGPYIVTSVDSGYRVHDIQLAVHNDTCEVFMSIVPNGLAQMWDNDAMIERIPFYLGTGLPSTEVDELAPANSWNRNIEDVYADASGNWSIAVYSVDEFNEETGYFLVNNYIQTSLFLGSGEQINELTLHADTLGRYECAMGHLREQTISKSQNGYTLTSLFQVVLLLVLLASLGRTLLSINLTPTFLLTLLLIIVTKVVPLSLVHNGQLAYLMLMARLFC
ncbi:MAG: hypothetical protein IPP40_15445 [bacterium]|nr:hypothetical protein [bacterium]